MFNVIISHKKILVVECNVLDTIFVIELNIILTTKIH